MVDILDKDAGSACRKCGAAIHRVDPQPIREFLRPFADPLRLATYQCSGALAHRWTYRITSLDMEAGVAFWELIPEEDFRAGEIPTP